MVEELAVMAVKRKMELETSIILGNYEFYYAAGVMAKRTGLTISQLDHPKKVWEEVMHAGFQPENDGEKYLLQMMEGYKPKDEFDDQMKHLFACGMEGM